MITDASLFFADKQVVSVTAYGTKAIDCGQALLTTGLNGKDYFVACMATAPYAGSATVSLELCDCSTESGAYTVCAATAPVALTKLSEQPLLLKFPIQHKRYIKAHFVISGTPATTGKLTAFVTDSKDAQQLYTREDGSFQ